MKSTRFLGTSNRDLSASTNHAPQSHLPPPSSPINQASARSAATQSGKKRTLTEVPSREKNSRARLTGQLVLSGDEEDRKPAAKTSVAPGHAQVQREVAADPNQPIANETCSEEELLLLDGFSLSFMLPLSEKQKIIDAVNAKEISVRDGIRKLGLLSGLGINLSNLPKDLFEKNIVENLLVTEDCINLSATSGLLNKITSNARRQLSHRLSADSANLIIDQDTKEIDFLNDSSGIEIKAGSLSSEQFSGVIKSGLISKTKKLSLVSGLEGGKMNLKPLNNFSNLRELDIHASFGNFADLRGVLRNSNRLESLALRDSKIHYATFEKIIAPRVKQIKALSLEFCGNIISRKNTPGSALDILQKFSDLRHLSIRGMPVDRPESQAIGKLTNLISLSIDSCNALGFPANDINDLLNLKILSLRGYLGRFITGALTGLRNLEILDMSGTFGLLDNFFTNSNLSSLKVVCAPYYSNILCHATNANIANLESLAITNGREYEDPVIGERVAGLRNLPHLDSLKHLAIPLFNHEVTPLTIQSIKCLNNLEHLVLADNCLSMSDEIYKELSTMKNLKKVDIVTMGRYSIPDDVVSSFKNIEWTAIQGESQKTLISLHSLEAVQEILASHKMAS